MKHNTRVSRSRKAELSEVIRLINWNMLRTTGPKMAGVFALKFPFTAALSSKRLNYDTQ
jgi:hypothetical protein